MNKTCYESCIGRNFIGRRYHNIRYLCPPLATYVRNCYKIPSRLFIAGGAEISSAEGTTQGDPSAMPAYAIGILPLLTLLKPSDNPQTMKHVAYADDLGGGSTLEKLSAWWDNCVLNGPALGYHPKASKSWLIVKEDQLENAHRIFDGTGINITTEGKKYLGGFIGKDTAAIQYVNDLVDSWINQLDELVNIAKSEPQAAYTAFTAGFIHKMTYFIRTIPNLHNTMKRIDEKIDKDFIPAITEGHICSSNERSLLSLPVRMGGLGIPQFSKICESEFKNSTSCSEQLINNIKNQLSEYKIDKKVEKERVIRASKEKIDFQTNLLEQIRCSMNKEELRANDLAQLKGGSSWLTALPLKEEGYYLSKREFFDAIKLRYRWNLSRLPLNCECGKMFDTVHAMDCKKGGFVSKRHDKVRNTLAKMMDTVAYDVRIEPQLQPLSGEILNLGSANREDEARLDISARGFWNQNEMAFFDVRVFNPFAKSYMNSSLDALFKSNERAKKREYNQRVIEVEHGSFTPIVMSAFGGCGRETNRFISEVVSKLSEKKDIPTSVMSNYVRTKLSFDLVRAQVMSVRGSRRLWASKIDTDEAEVVHYASVISD